MMRISATEVMIEHNSKLARDPAHLRRLMAFWPEENIVHQLAKKVLADMESKGVPEGWRLVPVKPTASMISAGKSGVVTSVTVREIYDHMLAATPEVEQ